MSDVAISEEMLRAAYKCCEEQVISKSVVLPILQAALGSRQKKKLFILELDIPTQDHLQIGRALESIGREMGPGDPKVGDSAPLFSSEGYVGRWRIVEE